jgi:hypothetical protein
MAAPEPAIVPSVAALRARFLVGRQAFVRKRALMAGEHSAHRGPRHSYMTGI